MNSRATTPKLDSACIASKSGTGVTFHHNIWKIEPGGNTCLLTGANGSGKSTLVDALLTLLVPNNKRNYNQASGSGGRKERDERTYVRGAYGKVKSEEDNASKTQYLRTDKDYTVVLAYFYNQESKLKTTLAQVFWLQESAVKKFFVVANDGLAIAQHFSGFDSIKELRKRLKAVPGVEVFDEFANYSKQFRKIFGLESEKALDLFNQTVSIKEIGKLNDFVREHMLEKTDVQTKIKVLDQNYEDLTRSHDAIQKAQRQLDHLKPLLAEALQFEKLKDEVTKLERCAAFIPAYFAQQKIVLLKQKKAESEQQLDQVCHRRKELVRQLDDLQQQKLELWSAICNDKKGQRVQELEREIKRLDERLSVKKKQAEKYNELARLFNLPTYSDETTFYASTQKGNAYRQAIDENLEKLRNDLVERQIGRSRLKEQYDELTQELQSLRQRKSQIPDDNLRIRRRILKDLEIDEDDIPFIGELLKVKDKERMWEGAIERLLQNFGLCLLVPEKHYRSVNQYVNKTNLKGRIVFYRVSAQRSYPQVRNPDDDFVIHKLELKPSSEFHDWIKNELIAKFDYVCCEDLEQFQRESRAIMKSGLIKSGNARHEKDDRRSLNDPRNYILGWNNLDKISAIEAELADLAKNIGDTEKAIQDIEKERKQRDRQKEQLRDFLQFDNFSVIDWKIDEIEKQKLADQKKQLEESLDHLKQLQEQLNAVNARIAGTEEDRSTAEKKANNLERDIQDYQKQQDECKTLLSKFLPEEVQTYAPRIETVALQGRGNPRTASDRANLNNKTLTLDNITLLERQVQESDSRKINEEKDNLSRLEKSIEKGMQKYKWAYPDETDHVDASVAAIGEFARMLETIEREDLPRYAKRFKQLLDEKVITSILIFKSALEKQVEEIEENIRNLNESLKTIDYTPSTFIKLQHDVTRDGEIKEFRNTLRDCLPDVGRQTPEANEASFQKIKALIDRFKQEERWTSKVTDVRNWLDFSASEKYKEDSSEKHHYSDSSGKSGGQKAKLAYTILASAIAYQFGLNHGETKSKSFRFVVVDEAFSKSDNANAHYAMELFKQLNLQLLVVTPKDKINIVENYIAAVHFVANNREENNSTIHNISIDQYRKERDALHSAAPEP